MFRVPSELASSLRAIDVALNALMVSPSGAGVASAVDQARAEVNALPPDLTAHALRRLVREIEKCHQDGQASHPDLVIARLRVTRVLQIDSRWP